MARLRAGIARTAINPPLGVDLCGYAGRVPGCVGVHDDLHAKALVISDGGTKAAIVTLDLIGLDDRQVAAVRKSVSEGTGIRANNILIGCSHTHSGPAPITIRACGNACETYVSDLLQRISDAVVAAERDLRPASFGHGSAEADIAINRRQRTQSGIELGHDPQGMVDYKVGVWRFTDSDGKSIATIFNYACHAVVMGGDNRLVSADWPGAAQRKIEREIGGQAMFLQGCCGNINPSERGTFEIVEKLGGRVGEAVLSALPGIQTVEDPAIDVCSTDLRLPLQPPVSREEAAHVAEEMQAFLDKVVEETPLWEIHINQAYRDWAQRILEQRNAAESVPFEVQKFALGDSQIIGLPGEVFVEYALQIKGLRRHTMVAGYTNGNVGYVPTQDAFSIGGYEVDLAYKLYGEQMLDPGAESLIVQTAADML